MLVKPATHSHLIPADTLAPVLPFHTLFNLFPFPEPALHINSSASPGSLPVKPVWYAWQEAWYQSFCRRLWPVLEKDDDADLDALAQLEECLQLQLAAGADERNLWELREDTRALERTRRKRWDCIYALHHTRRRFLRYHAASDRTDEEIIRDEAVRLEEEPRGPPYDQNSVRPTSTPHSEPWYQGPCGCFSIIDARSPSTINDWPRFVLPDVRSDASEAAYRRLHGADVRGTDEEEGEKVKSGRRFGLGGRHSVGAERKNR
ncbi:hypothetical protein JCM8097_006295 [Rhodosporidiobolus ruineniae]